MAVMPQGNIAGQGSAARNRGRVSPFLLKTESEIVEGVQVAAVAPEINLAAIAERERVFLVAVAGDRGRIIKVFAGIGVYRRQDDRDGNAPCYPIHPVAAHAQDGRGADRDDGGVSPERRSGVFIQAHGEDTLENRPVQNRIAVAREREARIRAKGVRFDRGTPFDLAVVRPQGVNGIVGVVVRVHGILRKPGSVQDTGRTQKGGSPQQRARLQIAAFDIAFVGAKGDAGGHKSVAERIDRIAQDGNRGADRPFRRRHRFRGCDFCAAVSQAAAAEYGPVLGK